MASRIARWKKTLDSPLRRAWAHGYLQSLGSATVTALGYDFDELSSMFPPQPGFDGAWDQVIKAAGCQSETHNGTADGERRDQLRG